MLGTLVHKGSANDPRGEKEEMLLKEEKILQAHKSSKKRRHGIERKI